MKKLYFILSILIVGISVALFSLKAGEDNKKQGTSCCSKAQAQETSVTGTLVSAAMRLNKNTEGSGSGCPMQSASESKACSGKAQAQNCPHAAAAQAASCNCGKKDCCKNDGSEKCGCKECKNTTAYGIVDKDGKFYLAVPSEKICNTKLGSHISKTVKLSGILTERSGHPAIVANSVQEVQ